eukprot:CAMPEP_0171273866 /NCGR_PEP_ID=MMETSP0790-20130122/62513_1 /TAXON_ID=2925 /ORGANISM="Alexandrium catenella, Strain OF101" /LENGTH=118 /DNA_ID=CAMNT_0011742883 /DNA_START=253 /DNA_END=606 /DNA_ORIENTATION=+
MRSGGGLGTELLDTEGHKTAVRATLPPPHGRACLYCSVWRCSGEGAHLPGPTWPRQGLQKTPAGEASRPHAVARHLEVRLPALELRGEGHVQGEGDVDQADHDDDGAADQRGLGDVAL